MLTWNLLAKQENKGYSFNSDVFVCQGDKGSIALFVKFTKDRDHLWRRNLKLRKYLFQLGL